tara:strand:+ start:77268 stop:79301 length:2034 start_codon:yes stop_codon:yes gene_type:complete
VRFPNGLLKIGVSTWQDLLFYFPSKYTDESKITDIAKLKQTEVVQLQVQVLSSVIVFRPKRTLIVKVFDTSGVAELRFLHFRQSFKDFFSVDRKIKVSGVCRISSKGFEFIHPKVIDGWYPTNIDPTKFLVSTYPSIKGVSQDFIKRWIKKALDLECPKEWLPPDLLEKYDLPTLEDSFRQIHQPQIIGDSVSLIDGLQNKTNRFWKRIKIDELVAQQISFRNKKKAVKRKEVKKLLDKEKLANHLIDRLPFKLTKSQKKVWEEVRADLAKPSPTRRLIQGDVGSGKTVIAALAVATAVGSNMQAAIMTPSELLALQVFRKMEAWFSDLEIKLVFLSSAQSLKEKKINLKSIFLGDVNLVVGTHALIQSDVTFKNLGLSIIDEQHKFGVNQREKLSSNGCHLLGMSATPIPRSLAMTFLADLDISTVDEAPKSRGKIITKLVSSDRRQEILKRIKVFIRDGGQAFWVCPMIDDAIDANRALKTLSSTEKWLRSVFEDELAVVHGKLTKDEKKVAMKEFEEGKRKILLATTVIEVGIDVPNAGLIIVENSERFGLAQLHQLRGRVGRGGSDALCIFLYSKSLTDLAIDRLKILHSTTNGFEIAKRDLELRGPGEILGTKQSGENVFIFCNLNNDWSLLNDAIYLTNELVSRAKLKGVPNLELSLSALVSRWSKSKNSI